jgi:hypothetical protein
MRCPGSGLSYNDDDIYLDSVPFGAPSFTAPLQWQKFSKTITVPTGAEYLTFSLDANHNVTNSANVTVTGQDGNPCTVLKGSSGVVILDNIIIRRVVPPRVFSRYRRTKL